jgi:integrase
VRRWFYDPTMAVINCAVRSGLCAPKLIRKPKVKTPPPDYCELEYLEKLWAACLKPKLRALLIFLPYTGCRLGECLALTWGRVNLDGEYAFILQTKNGEPRTVDLPPIVIEALRSIRPQSPHMEDSVFGYQTAQGVAWCVRRACTRAGLPYKRPHVIGSHTYATWMRRYFGLDGVGLTMTGRWKDPRSTEKYAHAHVSEVAKKSRLLPTPVQKSVQ